MWHSSNPFLFCFVLLLHSLSLIISLAVSHYLPFPSLPSCHKRIWLFSKKYWSYKSAKRDMFECDFNITTEPMLQKSQLLDQVWWHTFGVSPVREMEVEGL
jgi:hypothetical protein